MSAFPVRTLGALAAVCGGELAGADVAFAEPAIDSRKLARGDLFFALPGERVDGHDYVAAAATAGAAGAVVAHRQPVELPQIVVANVAQALTAAARAWRRGFGGCVLGVAGSNGKTTVKEMLASILAQSGPTLATLGNLNNHLGVPLTLLRLRAEHRFAVIEMGANAPGEVAALAALAEPSIGLVTNAGAEHLEGFGSLEGAARAEGELFAALPASGVAIVNGGDAFAALWSGMTRARVRRFGLGAGAEVRAENLRPAIDASGFSMQFDLVQAQDGGAERTPVRLALAGRHNVVNALAAAGAAAAAGAGAAHIRAGLAAMRAVNGRLQFKLAAGGAWILDDSYNANPSSAQAALAVLAELPGPRWLVLGDMAELGAHAEAAHKELGSLARACGVERMWTHGQLAALAAESFGTGAERHADVASLLRSLAPALRPEVRLLVKGSRVNRLERVVEALTGATAAARKAG